jgi:hypothetical protein
MALRLRSNGGRYLTNWTPGVAGRERRPRATLNVKSGRYACVCSRERAIVSQPIVAYVEYAATIKYALFWRLLL